MHTVVETPSFKKGSEDIGMSEEERQAITVAISKDPLTGDIIPGTGGARKLRFPFKGKGKSGGCRVITYYAGEDVPVFLLDVFSKDTKINSSEAERNQMKVWLANLADDYRQHTIEKVAFAAGRVQR